MSTTVDERVVSMQFDNAQFEKGVQQTLNSLNTLNKNIEKNAANNVDSFKGLSSGLTDVKNAISAGIIPVLDTVQNKFSIAGTMIDQTLRNITNKITSIGESLASAFTTDPIKTGFEEYETQINAVQTILANTSSKGTTLDQVNAALDELNHYADMTIYNFTEMTRNIGTFTAAGVDLDTSVAAIKGIANLAAVSGSNSQQASTAMYQLSQALAAGTVKLQDWNSVVNAGMGGQVFQDALKETARVHGVAIDEMIKSEGSFRETLKDGWLSSDILTETLSKFTGDLNEDQLRTMGYSDEQIKSIIKMGETANDAATKVKTFTQLFDTLKEAAQSGWTQSWEIIVGDFEEAKEILTRMSDIFSNIINNSSDARNKMLQEWKDLGGRTELLKSFENIFKSIASVIKPIKGAFSSIFPPQTGKNLLQLTKSFESFTEKLILSESAGKNLRRTFRGVFSIFDILKQAFSAVVKAILPVGNNLTDFAGGLLNVTGTIGDFLTGVSLTLKETDFFNQKLSALKNFLLPIGDLFKTITDSVLKFFDSLSNGGASLSIVDDLFGSLGKRLSGLSPIVESIKTVFSGVINLFKNFIPVITNISGTIVKSVGIVTSNLLNNLKTGNFNGIFDILNGVLSVGLFAGIKKFIDSLNEIVTPDSTLFGFLKNLKDSILDTFGTIQDNLKAESLKSIAGAIAILSVSLIALSLIDSKKLFASLAAMGGLFAELTASMAALDFISSKFKGKGVTKLAGTMIMLSTAVAILSLAMKQLSGIDSDGMAQAITGIAGLMLMLTAVSTFMAKYAKKLSKGGLSLIFMATAINILTKSVITLSELDPDALKQGLKGVVALLAEVAGFEYLSKFGKMGVTMGAGLIAFATGIRILVSSVGVLGGMDIGTLIKGLVSLGIVFVEITAAIQSLPKSTPIIAVGLLTVSAAVAVLSGALKVMESMSWEGVAKGLIALGGSLLILSIGLNSMTGAIPGAIAMLIVAPALIALSGALTILGKMKLPEIGKAVLALAGSLLVLAVGLTAMIAAIPGALALLVVVPALTALAGVLKILGSMNAGDSVQAILTLAGALVVIGGLSAVLGIVAPLIAAFGAALLLVASACTVAGLGIVLIATGLSSLASISVSALSTFLIVLTTILESVKENVPIIIDIIKEVLIGVLSTIIETAPLIATAVVRVISAILTTLSGVIPEIVESVVNILTNILKTLAEYTPDIVDAGGSLIVGFINGIADKIPDVVDAAFNLVISFIDGLTTAIENNTDLVIVAIDNLVNAIGEAFGKVALGTVDIGINFVRGFIDGLGSMIDQVIDSVKNLASSVVTTLKNVLGIHSPSRVTKWIGEMIDKGMEKGINDNADKPVTAIDNMGDKITDSVNSIDDNTSDGLTNLSSNIEKVGDSTDKTTKSVDKNTKSINKNTKSKKANSKAAKEAAKAAKTHAKYLKYVDSVATQYMHTSSALNETIDDTSALEKAKTAITDLAKEMYEASLTGDETADELAKKQQKIEESFVKTYETIRDKIKGSLDMMKTFDIQASSLTKPKDILKNMQSQFLGTAELVSRQFLLGQKGLNPEYLQELINKGTEGLPEINNLLRMSNEQIQEFNKGLIARKGWSNFIAQNGLAAIASAKHNQQLRAIVKTQEEQIAKAKEINDTYSDISQRVEDESGVIADVMNGALNGLSQQFMQIAADMGVTTDQLTNYVNGTELTVEQASLKQIDNYNQVKQAFIEYSDTVGTESDRIKSALSNLTNSFDELKLRSKDDKTFSITDMQDNIQSQIDGINKWSTELTHLAGKIDNKELLQQLADMGTGGYKYVHALYEASDIELDEFVDSFKEKMDTIKSVSLDYGHKMGLNVVDGLNSSLTMYFQQLHNSSDQSFGALAALMNKQLESVGKDSGDGLSSGIQDSQETVVASATQVANSLEASVAAIVNKDSGYKKTADYMIGMLQGLKTYKKDVLDEIDEITSAMEGHTADGLDVHSPSRFTKWVGKNLILGFIKGFSENKDSLMNSTDSIVNSMKDAISSAYDILTTDADMNPTITPVLDLSDLENRSKSIGSLFNSKSLNLNAKLGTVHTANENTAKLNEMLQGMNAQNNKGGNSYNFVQNNYSPKALSRLDIYRQTKNQFAQMKGVVNSNG